MMSRQSVLVVEDEEDIMEVIRFNLEKEGYEVHQALSGEKALQVIENKLPSLVLLDLMLPGINGTIFVGSLSKTIGQKLFQ